MHAARISNEFKFPKLKDKTIAYWLQDPNLNWPVKVISPQQGASLGATIGSVVPVRGCVVSAKFVLGRPLLLAERILGMEHGELAKGALLLRLNRLPYTDEFDLASGYTNVASNPGYTPGQGLNQWILTADVLATVIKIVGPSQSL